MEIEAVFIETEMIKAWNVNFLKKRGVLKKIWSLKLYLPRQKWSKLETLISFELRGVVKKKKYGDWSCIYRDRNDQSLKR